MKTWEIPFTVPLSGTVRVSEDGEVTVKLDRAEITVTMSESPPFTKRSVLEDGMTIGQVILEVAQGLAERGQDHFSTPELYREALIRYPDINRGSFWSQIIACTINHPSRRHHRTQADFLVRVAPGVYRLNDRYIPGRTGRT